MRTISYNAFEISELSEAGKQLAYQHWLSNSTHYEEDYSDLKNSLEAFCKVFNLTRAEYNIGYPGTYISFKFKNEEPEVEGQRLRTWIWNNYKSEIFNGKYYGKLRRKENGKTEHIKR